ncbi:hypothetical protein AMJ40_01815 [candidate division TA06 bacterium DG_26]|uniref:Carboxypeptidase Q n=1 Tax=candidate division TA06 bacterium DG_26 TaxID=1703771 RepID=A0A0S7WKV4_UNCT6|nr:MAG: hypothetical protein AMJ40_01815 [candidate division TA06 bacterium DG_26]
MEILFSGERAFRHLKKLTVGLGHRPAGSDEERKAASYIKGEFEKYGLVSTYQNVPITTYRPKLGRLQVLEPKLGEVPCEVVGLCAPTPARGVVGELRFVETGDEEYLSGNLKGKILLIIGPVRYPKYGRLMKMRPRGLIIMESEVGKPPSRVEILPEWRKRFGGAPMLRISLEDGLRLLKENSKVVKIEADFSERKGRSANVIGELTGRRIPEEIAIIGGHYDSSPGVQGASDNASGTAIVLELARVFSTHGSARTLRFVAWGAEELGLRGSVHYARQLARMAARHGGRMASEDAKKPTELEKHRLCVNLDVHGIIVGKNRASILGPQDLISSVRLLSKERGPAIEVVEDVHSSDSTALSKIGVPSISFTRHECTAVYLHTPLDKIDYLDAEHLQMYGEFVEVWLKRHVADALSFPFERTIPDPHRKKIEDYFTNRLGVTLEAT